MDISKQTQEDIAQLQTTEQNLQSFLLQKQQFQINYNEVEHALKEIENAQGATYKIIGGIMVEENKEDLTKELTEKKEILSLRITNLEKQEEKLKKNLEALQEKIMKNIKQ